MAACGNFVHEDPEDGYFHQQPRQSSTCSSRSDRDACMSRLTNGMRAWRLHPAWLGPRVNPGAPPLQHTRGHRDHAYDYKIRQWPLFQNLVGKPVPYDKDE